MSEDVVKEPAVVLAIAFTEVCLQVIGLTRGGASEREESGEVS